MILTYRKMEGNFVLSENVLYTIVIESPALMCQFIEDLYSTLNTSDDSFSLFLGEKKLNVPKIVDFIYNPFGIELNQKKIITKIYQQMEGTAEDAEFFQETLEMKNMLNKYVSGLLAVTELPLVYDYNFQVSKLLSGLGISLDQEISLLDRLLQYVDLYNKILGVELFIFYGLSNLFSQSDIEQFAKEVAYKKIYLVLLENSLKDWFPKEKIKVVDKDLCVVMWHE